MTASFLIDVGPYIVAGLAGLNVAIFVCACVAAYRDDDLLEDPPGGMAPAAPCSLGAAPVPQAPGEGAGPSTVHPDWDAAWDRTWWR